MSAKITSARKYYNCTSIGLGSGATAASLVVARGLSVSGGYFDVCSYIYGVCDYLLK